MPPIPKKPLPARASKEPRVRAPRRKLVTHTIHDVAALADVSSITVSRYFNAPDKVSQAVRERLREVIAATGYVPSQVAGRLASGQARVVGAVMQNTASTTFADLVRGMTDGFDTAGLQLLLANTDYSQQLEERAVRAFAGWHPSALIVTRDDHTPDTEALLRAVRAPVVETWGVVPGRPFHQVGFPHDQVGVELAQHFIERGAKRIRFAMRPVSQDFRAQQRAMGYAAAMREAGLKIDIVTTTEAADEFEAGAEVMRRLRQEPRRTRAQAIVFANDSMAAGAILQAPSLGLQLPGDCAVSGFGDAPIAAHLHPALTTMRPAPYDIGMKAARLVLDLMAQGPQDEPIPRQLHVVPCRLVVRDSSRIGR
jgi:LacI family gluconate utilization system Gnt-I transcriptional repressor